MRILVVGQGGREHALCWKLADSPSVSKIFCAPGNSGTANHAENVRIPDDDRRELVRFAQREKIDLVVVGPELPLVEGLVDDLAKVDIAAFGPSKAAAQLEGSKIFCKELMKKARIPSADFRVYSEMDRVEQYFRDNNGPCVVKADGLAAGKGAIVCDSAVEGLPAARKMLVDREFGKAGERILIEERLDGVEASVLAITDGSTIAMLEPCQDHKRALNGDKGPNTGGMGAYSPANIVTHETMAMIERDVMVPIVHALRRDKKPFKGVLYAGIMLTSSGPKVLEFNARFGDPECQPLLMRLQGDLAQILMASVRGDLDKVSIGWDPRPAVCVVMASDGYPGSYPRGIPIRGLDVVDKMEDVRVFHAGAKRDDGRIVTSGGRVLGVTALGSDLKAAQARAYEAVRAIQFAGAHYRTDIADRAIAAH